MEIIYFVLYLLIALLISAILLWIFTRITWSGAILRLESDGNFKIDGLFYTWKGLEIILVSFSLLSGIALANRVATRFGSFTITYVFMAVLTVIGFYALVVWLRSWEDTRSKLMQVNYIKYPSHQSFIQSIKTSMVIYLLVAVFGTIIIFFVPSLSNYFAWLPLF